MQNLELNKARTILNNGGIIAIPTETVYGLAANAFDQNAIQKVFTAKNRPLSDPLIVHCASIPQINDIVLDFPQVLKKLAQKFWPGPLTILLNKKSIISDLVTAGQKKVAVRVPNHPLTIELLESLDFPLVAPSANPFGYVSPTTAEHVKAQLETKIDYILDGGSCGVGVESTIISLDANENIIIHRLGGIGEAEIAQETEKKVIAQSKHQSKVCLPGSLDSHYAPRKKVVLGDIASNYQQYKNKKVAILSFSFSDNSILEKCIHRKLTKGNSVDEAAQNLFKYLRELDLEDIEIILAERVPAYGIGAAINDRLSRAAS